MIFLLFLLLLSPAYAQRQVSDAEVKKVHDSAIVIDLHNDVPMRTIKKFDIGSTGQGGDTDIARLKAGGVAAQFFSAYVAGRYVKTNSSYERGLAKIKTIREDIAGQYPRTFVLALKADDILAARKQGKIAALIGLEGGHAIEDSLDKLREFFKLGVRYMTLSHSNTNNWADSSGDISKQDVKHHGGLTDFGRKVVSEMNRLGMMIDISHVADDTFWDVMETSRAPVIASHSSCRALSKVPRNMTDDMIRAMAKKGGVIHINFACEFLSQAYADSDKELKRKIRARHSDDMYAIRKELAGKIAPATMQDVVAHINHVVKIAGEDAVGLGSDFDGIDCVPQGLEDVSKFPNLTRALLEKGYTPERIRKIYGGNTLRVMRAVEKAAEAR